MRNATNNHLLIFAIASLFLILTFTGQALGATELKPGHLPTTDANSKAIDNILAIVNGLTGAIALLIIVVSGFRYITSGGDPQKASNAKNGIVYALIGVAVVIAAEAIILFILNRI